MTSHPIDATTRTLLLALSTKLEAIVAYERLDAGPVSGREIRERVREDERRQADVITSALRARIESEPRPAMPRARHPRRTGAHR